LGGHAARESCGIFAVFGRDDAARLAHLALFALQHRGQESAGIVASDGKQVRSLKGLGLLGEAVPADNLGVLPGHLAIGHVRYSTTGGGRKPQNIQPLVLEYSKGLFGVAHNGNLVNSAELRHECESLGSIFQTSTDSEIVVHLLARPENLELDRPLARCLARLRGAYSFVFLTRDGIVAARDPHGFRPLAMGRLGDAVVFASETCAFDLLGATYVRDVEPGEIIEVSTRGGTETVRRFAPSSLTMQPADVAGRERRVPHAARAVLTSYRIEGSEGVTRSHCIFEHIYFARPDSRVFGETVHDVRVGLGARLAEDHPADADIVVPVPDSGRSSALGYSRRSGIPFDRGFIRNHYVGRTFIMPSGRAGSVEIKLNAVRSVVDGKRVVVVDDSIIRGTTSRKRLRLLREAGAREIHVRISAPPCKHPCYYGIDFPSRGELVAAERDVAAIRAFLGVDSLRYQSVEGMLSAVSRPGDYCAACFTGKYPEPAEGRMAKCMLENAAMGD